MTRKLLPLSFGLLLVPGMAQQVIFSEDFEGAQPAFTLNATDLGSTASGANKWLINNVYAGGAGTIDCMGFPIPFDVPSTPGQPAGVSNQNGNYMHITSTGGIASGVLNCHFAAADGFCTPAENFFARMSGDINTEGAGEVTLKFWWLCAGSSSNYGQVYYSTNGGTSWVQITQPLDKYQGQSTWTQQTITMPEFSGQSTLRFGFRFVNGSSLIASDPGFAVDDVIVTTSEQDPNAILTGTIQPTTHCPGSTVLIPYTATGVWAAGNVFTAQLSDAQGNFDQAVDIGSVASTFSGTITGTIPANTPLGTGYLVRVRGSDPAMMGTVSITALTIVAGPSAGQGSHFSLCRSDDPRPLFNHLTGADTCGSWTFNGEPFPDIIDPATAQSGVYVYTTNCPGGCPQDQSALTIGIVEAPDAGIGATITVCDNDPALNLFSQLGGTPDAGGMWTGASPLAGGMFVPGTSTPGCYDYEVVGVAPCPSAVATVCVEVETCTGVAGRLNEEAGMRWLGQSGMMHVLALGGFHPEAVEVLDATGRKARVTVKQEGGKFLLSMEAAPAGMYFVRAVQQGRTAVVRMVHQR